MKLVIEILLVCLLFSNCNAREYIKPDLIKIPYGHFIMGCVRGRDIPVYIEPRYNGECPADELYPQIVDVDTFMISPFELTFDEWDKCQLARFCRVIDDFGYGRGRRPVSVSKQDVFHYIDWLNKKSGLSYRLPTEREWEYAARGGNDYSYPWAIATGYTVNVRNDEENVSAGREVVGSYSANPFGLFDVFGGVPELVTTESSLVPNPIRRLSGKVLSKGNFERGWEGRFSSRGTPISVDELAHSVKYLSTGFRLALTIKKEGKEKP